jgi:maleylpyruvate isomerase
MTLTLHNYFRSSASYRVRIALNLKGLPYEQQFVHLNRDGGEQFKPAFTALNPQALVPVLDDGEVSTSQSMAILEYLEERHPEVPLLPHALADRAYVRRLAQYIACDIHPLQNLRVLKFLTGPLQLDEAAKTQWLQHWLGIGVAALERDIAGSGRAGRFCFGDTPTLADCCLMPQLFSARRFNIDLTGCPTLTAIEAACNGLEAFRAAEPGRQPDAE